MADKNYIGKTIESSEFEERVLKRVEQEFRERRRSSHLFFETDVEEFFRKLADVDIAESEEGVVTLPPTIYDTLLSEKMVREIKPEVSELRQKLFAHTRKPFRSLGGAAKWIESRSKEKLKRQTLRQWQDLMKLVEDFNKKGHPQAIISLHSETLPYLAADRSLKLITASHPELVLLAVKSRKIANNTGFSQVAVVTYILTGRKPRIPSVRLSVRVFPYFQTTIELNSPDISVDQLKDVYRTIRQLAKIKYRKPLGDAAQNLLRVYSMVVDREHKTVQSFWQEVARLSGKPTWKAAQMSYGRLIKRHPELRVSGEADGARGK